MITRARFAGGVVTTFLCFAVMSACSSFKTSPFTNVPLSASGCRIGQTQSSLLITEWDSAEKANLEASLRQGGAVAVAFSGCDMQVLPQCELAGSYAWEPTTVSTDVIEINNEADLHATLPLGVASLSGELRRSGQLYVSTTIAGQKRLQGFSAPQLPNTSACMRATHIISALTVGAFQLSVSANSSRNADVGVRGVGIDGSQSSSTSLLRSSGRTDACFSMAENPPLDCAAPLRVFLSAVPGRSEVVGPPGTVKVDFVSASTDERWDVYVDDQAACTTPCSKWVDPHRPLRLRSREDRPDKLIVRNLNPNAGPLQVVGKPKSKAKFSTGVTFTALGGIGVAAGVSLIGIGCTSDRDSMCTAGKITALSGAIVTTGALLLLLDSFAKVGVRPLYDSRAQIRVGPGFVAGSF